MLADNVINPSKKDKIISNVFHVYYPDSNSSILFDNNFVEPIIHGSKNVVMTTLKNINKYMVSATPDTKVYVFSYILSPEGYRRVHSYYGPISTIGKHVPLK